ncbi:cas scaffolding protein family member 4 [Clarias gariepinus]|uniref:cas scaffolding protein family member 4 n=1 Tax=Clarias gariepinus TaxID=13013 RepID=UPI00234C9F87|nr:cas scaffolding protein family member 4 [Clarias gariepinus]
METIFAKALYDNTAETPDELAFHKGDVVVVIQKTVEGSLGWWKCSLHGREGLAPANRLRLLSPSESIYQTPRPSEANPTYELMDGGYKVPSATNIVHNPELFPSQERNHSLNKMIHDASRPSPPGTLYAVPSLGRKSSLFTPVSPRPMVRKMSAAEIQKRYEIMDNSKCKKEVYAVPHTPSKDCNYDVPVPSKNVQHLKQVPSCSTLPTPRKLEQIYDVPVAPEKALVARGFYGTMPAKGTSSGKDLYDTPPPCVRPSVVPGGVLYDIPKCSEEAQQKKDFTRPEEEGIYDVPPSIKQIQPTVNGLTVPNQTIKHQGNFENVSKPLEYRCKAGPGPDHPLGRSSWGRKIMLSRELQERGEKNIGDEVKNGKLVSVSENQRNSTVSTTSTTSSSSSSSRSSCDSRMFSSPSPEPLREVTLSPEEAAQRLLQLQETVCRAVPKLMNFVSSHWRSREHLSQHLQEIRASSEHVANSVTSFLSFALDIRGNAQRLTDCNLQTRLLKQLSIVEDSGLILQTSVSALGGLGWSLDVLAQDHKQPHSPDQLERFVMVARTLPEDVKRLVSIINANSKLLFRNSSKEPEMSKDTTPPHARKSPSKNKPLQDTHGDEDYVQLQTKTEFEKQQQSEAKSNKKLDKIGENEKKQVSKPEPTCPESTSQQPCKTIVSDHCHLRLYFGAIKKAIAVFVASLEEQNPPEKFISHSKLVIMAGQRLIDTLFSEAQSRQDNQELLYKSNHLCALLKQLAVATKKAALHFPDQVALQEAKDFARELAQRAHHFRMSLDI